LEGGCGDAEQAGRGAEKEDQCRRVRDGGGGGVGEVDQLGLEDAGEEVEEDRDGYNTAHMTVVAQATGGLLDLVQPTGGQCVLYLQRCGILSIQSSQSVRL
jgi:hypothetical protein